MMDECDEHESDTQHKNVHSAHDVKEGWCDYNVSGVIFGPRLVTTQRVSSNEINT